MPEKTTREIMVSSPVTGSYSPLRLKQIRQFVRETAHLPEDRKVLNGSGWIQAELKGGE